MDSQLSLKSESVLWLLPVKLPWSFLYVESFLFLAATFTRSLKASADVSEVVLDANRNQRGIYSRNKSFSVDHTQTLSQWSNIFDIEMKWDVSHRLGVLQM